MSIMELRTRHVVLQQWDASCGAAALATLLTYDLDDPVSELDVARTLISRKEYLYDPRRVRRQGGFSLLDIKRAAESLGYRGKGIAGLSLDELADRGPAIVPINTFGFQHFVVFRGFEGDRVIVADPAYGRRKISRKAFERAWLKQAGTGNIAFFVERRVGDAAVAGDSET